MPQIIAKVRIIILILFLALVFGFYFVGNANAVVPAGCSDNDSNGCISVSDCQDPSNDPALGGTCSVCPAGNCGNNGLGQDCYSSDECDSGLCSDGGICVECMPGADEACDDQLDTCDRGVCVRRGGNGIGGLCRFDNQCASRNCGTNNLCVGGATTPTPTASNDPEDDWTGIDLTIQDVFSIIENFASLLIGVVTAIMAIFVIIAGLRFMAARGDLKAYEAAKKNFWHVFIGLLVIIGVYAIIRTVDYIVESLGAGRL